MHHPLRAFVLRPALPVLAIGLSLLATPHAGAATPAPLPPIVETWAGAPEPQVVQQVTEDDQVRIEELRVRGETRRLTVQPKVRGLPRYDMTVTDPSRATTSDPRPSQRVWLNLNF